MRFPYALRYLHEKPLPRNPKWNPGDPRHRIFMPLYWLRMVEHRKPMPSDFVKFECHWQMTKSDVREYLQKLYGVAVLDVRVEIEAGKYMDHPKMVGRLSPPLDDRKFAYVQLRDDTFVFPQVVDTSSDQNLENKAQQQNKIMENQHNKEANRNLRRLDIGGWFS